jgi:hypothetical protein
MTSFLIIFPICILRLYDLDDALYRRPQFFCPLMNFLNGTQFSLGKILQYVIGMRDVNLSILN